MHELVTRALAAIAVVADGALSVIPDAAFNELSRDFSQCTELAAHLEALVAAQQLYTRGLKLGARQLVALAETGLPLAEKTQSRLAQELMKASKSLHGSELGKSWVTLKPANMGSVGMRPAPKKK